jgi:hypothetical protein
VGGAGTCAWLGFRRSRPGAPRPSPSAPGAPGAGSRSYRGGVGTYRQANFVAAAPSNPGTSLYARQPQRVVTPLRCPAERARRSFRSARASERRESPDAALGSGKRTSSGRRTSRCPAAPPGRRETPSAPPPPAEHPEVERRTPPAPAPRENPGRRRPTRDPEGSAAAPAPREHHESPRLRPRLRLPASIGRARLLPGSSRAPGKPPAASCSERAPGEPARLLRPRGSTARVRRARRLRLRLHRGSTARLLAIRRRPLRRTSTGTIPRSPRALRTALTPPVSWGLWPFPREIAECPACGTLWESEPSSL